MPTEFKLPPLGENIESGDIVSVLVKEGDVIKPQQSVVEIETDKAVVEVPCAEGGRITKIHVKPGDTVNVGGALLSLETAAAGSAPAKGKAEPAKAASKTPEAKPAAPAPKPEPAKAAAPAKKSEPAEAPHRSGNGHSAAPQAKPEPVEAVEAKSDADADAPARPDPAGPAVRRLAHELGVDLHHVTGTGSGGRIVREDIIAAVRHANANVGTGSRSAGPVPTESDNWGGIHREPLTKIRKTIAANMARSASTIPHVTNFDDADVTELERIRKASAGDYSGANVKLTTLSFLMKAVALSLKQHRTMNASLDLENAQIIYKDYVNLGVAVDTARGLVVPVIRDVDRESIPHIAQAITALVEKSKTGQFTIEELRGGSFTISNLGAIGGTYSTPIINYPEVAILLVEALRKVPTVVDDRIEPRLMMPLSLSYDHRLVDGATAARFLNEVKGYLETPSRLLLAL